MSTFIDPYAPKVKAARRPAARRAPRNPPILRLRRVGVTAEEERDVLRRWAEMTDDERLEALDALANIRDSELRQQLAEARTEDEPYLHNDGATDDTAVLQAALDSA